jgi:hypothetical protein
VRSHLRAHTIVHLKFLARSRLLFGFVLLITLWSAVGLVPAIFFGTTSNRFELLKAVAGQLHWLAAMITSGLGLVVLWSHRRARSIKMIATKPSPFEGWVASVFAAAALVGIAAHTAVALVTLALSLYWGVPYQPGFLYMAADGFVESLIALGLLTALSAAMHPVIATILVLFVSESTFRFIGTALTGASSAGMNSPLLTAGNWLMSAGYYISPSFGPFDRHTAALEASLRVTTSDLRYLGATLLYALLACAFGYVATLVALRRRSLA